MAASVAGRKAGRFVAAGVVACMAVVTAGAQAAASEPFTVIAEGLDNPRGLAFGADGALYVAEAGRGGTGPCITGPEGDQSCFGLTGAVTRIKDGQQSRPLTGLPSLGSPDGSAIGPSDVSILGLGYLTIGLGADPAVRAQFPPSPRTFGQLTTFVPSSPGATPRIDSPVSSGVRDSPVRAANPAIPSSGSTLRQLLALVPGLRRMVPPADVAGYEASANPDHGAVDSNPQAVYVDNRGAAVTDAGGNSLVRVGFDGRLQTLAVFDSRMVDAPPNLDLPAQIPMQSVPTGVVAHDGAYFVSELTGFPFQVGAARVYRVVPGRAPQVYATGLTNAIDLAFGPDGTLYVLEIAHNSLLAEKPAGALVKVTPGRAPEVVLGGLNFPSGLTIRGNDAYLSDCGVCSGGGRVLQVPL